MRLIEQGQVIRDKNGHVLDDACGSVPAPAGFVRSAGSVHAHRPKDDEVLRIHGVEKTDETGRLCRLNLAA